MLAVYRQGPGLVVAPATQGRCRSPHPASSNRYSRVGVGGRSFCRGSFCHVLIVVGADQPSLLASRAAMLLSGPTGLQAAAHQQQTAPTLVGGPVRSKRGVSKRDEQGAGSAAAGRSLLWQSAGVSHGSRLDVSCDAHSAIPPAAGLFNPENDKDSCGVGFVGELSKQPSRKCVKDALKMLLRMTHRGACGCEANTGAL